MAKGADASGEQHPAVEQEDSGHAFCDPVA